MSDLTQTLSTGTALWNNRRHKVFCVAGQVASCEIDDWQVLYYEAGLSPNNDIFRRRSASEFFELNRDGLPRFIVLPSNPALWDEYIRGYLIGLSLVDGEPIPQGLPDFIAAVRLGKKHAYAAFERRMQKHDTTP